MKFCLGAWLVCAGCAAPSPPAEAPQAPPGEAWLTDSDVQRAELRVEPAAVHDLTTTVMTTGMIDFDDLKVSHIFSPVTGRISHIGATLGQQVHKGDVLSSIISPDLGQFSSDMAKARADLLAAKHDYVRQKSLFEGHAAARKDYEAAEDAYLKAQAELERTQQKSLLLQRHLSERDNVSQDYALRALIDGEVVMRAVNPGMEVQGQYAGGAAATELYTVGSMDTVWALADLFEMDMLQVQQGDMVRVQVVAYPGEIFTGTVDWVSQVLDPTTRTARVRCVVDNRARKLKPNMFATMYLEGQKTHVLALPNRSVYHLSGKTAVFVAAGGAPGGRRRFERREVKTDPQVFDEYVGIAAGLKVGELVVTSGGILLSELTQ